MKSKLLCLISLLPVFLWQAGFGQQMTISYPSSHNFQTGVAIAPVSPTMTGGPASSSGQTTLTLAGQYQGYSNGNGTAASFYLPTSVVADANGNVYVADSENHVIRKITPTGDVTTYAGSGTAGHQDGSPGHAKFNHPAGLAIDADGNIYVSDQYNHRIRKIAYYGMVSTVAGNSTTGSQDGTGSGAYFNNPTGIVFDHYSGNLFVGDYSNYKVRKVTLSGVVTTFAGNGTSGTTNGVGITASFRGPMGIAADASGNIYVADRLGFTIRKISPSGVVSTFAGSGFAGSADGIGVSASFNRPTGIAIDPSGNLYVTDENSSLIRKVSAAGSVSTLAGLANSQGSVNGTGSAVRFYSPYAICLDKKGNLYVAQLLANSIRKIITSAYTVIPDLPEGLSFNYNTGVISGTPAVVSPVTTYQVQAFNTTHSSNVATFSIGVTTPVSAINASGNQNYVIAYLPREAGITDNGGVINATSNRDKIQVNIQYFDGLGRLLQNVEWQATPGKRDLITPVVYDGFGREDKKILPYAATKNTSDGSYKPNALGDQHSFYTDPGGASWGSPGVVSMPGAAFSKTIYEAGPLNRVLEQGSSGSVWQPASGRTAAAGRTIVSDYRTNNITANAILDTGFAVRLYNAVVSTVAGQQHLRTLSGTGYYDASQLYLNIVKDENWTGLPAVDQKVGTTEEYKDKNGRLVLKRTFNKDVGVVQVLSTYYVYDIFGSLSFVLPPGANPDAAIVPSQDVLDDLCYQYRYDQRNRLIEKKIPGKGWEFMLYNKLDQVVGTQDALLRGKSPQQWLITKYDGLGRVVLTGMYTDPSNAGRQILQAGVDTVRVIWESRTPPSDYTSRSWPKTGFSTLTLRYYDNYQVPGLPVVSPYNLSSSYSQRVSGLPTVSKVAVLGTSPQHFLWNVNYYDDEGRIVRGVAQHFKGGETASNNYDDVISTYSFVNELTSTVRRHYVLGTERLYVANRMIYDHQGRIRDTYQKTGDNLASVGAEVLLSRNNYNEIGQLVSKQLHGTGLGTPVFAQTVTYSYNARGWLKGQSSSLFTQELKYEESVSGVVPQYNGNISRQEWGGKSYNYTYDKLNRLTSGQSNDNNHEKSIRYDLMGNVQGLQRYTAGALADQLKYNYSGNRLTSVVDSNAHASGLFQLPGTTTYVYDLNGNMISRINTGNTSNNITGITYNHMNLPATLTAGVNAVAYTYDATGVKLRKQVGGSLVNEYIVGIQYENGIFSSLQTSEGRVVRNSSGQYTYEYTLADHLGNGRLYFDINAGVARKIQETDYYPFGLSINRGFSGTENKYQYNGKEKQEEEKMFDYGARFYDPVIGRWNVIDNKSEKYPNVTPYIYAVNNPIIFIDPDGNDIVYFNSKGQEVSRTASTTQFRAFVDVNGSYVEASMPKIIKGYESPVFQKYDYNIAAQTFIFNNLSDDQLPKTPGGLSLTGDRPSDLDPTLVKAITIEETNGGTLEGKYGQKGKSDIMQSNVTTTSGQTDWSDSKKAFGLEKGKSATPNQSLHAGIRILYTKGLQTTAIKDKKGKVIGYSVTWRGDNWDAATKRYNGGGNPNYLEEVIELLNSAFDGTSENYYKKGKKK